MPHALIVHLRLSDNGFGSDADHAAVFDLEEQIEARLAETAAGELDGDEFGEGECVLFMYGSDADRLFAVVEPLLKSTKAASGGFAVKRYGDVSELDSQAVDVTW